MFDYQKIFAAAKERFNAKMKTTKLKGIPKPLDFGINDIYAADYVVIGLNIHNLKEIIRGNQWEKVAWEISAFYREVKAIFQDGNRLLDFHIDYSGAYGIFPGVQDREIYALFNTLALTNTFVRMFNAIAAKNDYPFLDVGLSASLGPGYLTRTYEVKDYLWLLPAIASARALAQMANTDYIGPMAITQPFYTRCIDELMKEEKELYEDNIVYEKTKGFYHMDIVYTRFSNWIDSLEED